MIRKSAKAWLSLLLLSSAGCSSLCEGMCNTEMKAKNFVITQKAWNTWSWCYDDLSYPMHFSRGFKDGYKNVLEGGNGCQPTLPPRWYWKPCYQSAEGRCKIAAWFDGFSHGALAAQQDGYGSLNQIPISPTARQNLLMRNAPPSQACFNGMYQGEIPQDVPMPEGAMDEEANELFPEEPPVQPGLAPVDDNPNAIRPYDESKQP